MVDIQTIKIPWCKPEVIELRHRRIVIPPTPPGMRPGVEYLEDSPFQGKKEIEEGPYNTNENTPGNRAFTVPLRDLDSSWTDKYSTRVIPKAPSKTLTVTDWNNSTTGEITDLTLRAWVLEEHDGFPGAFWPWPLDDIRGIGISLETMLAEELYTNLWSISYGTPTPYPGYSQWMVNRVSSGMNLSLTNAMQHADDWGLPTFYPINTQTGDSRNIIPVYNILLFRSVPQYLYCTNSAGSSHWHEKALAAYDIRPQFFDLVNSEHTTHPFFKAFSACQSSYPICKPSPGAAGLVGATDQGANSGIVLTFYIDLREGA